MKTLHFSVTVAAPRERVWDAMLSDATYREWTAAFNPSSYFRGRWETGEKMLFLGLGEGGVESGMVATIEESRHPEFVSIRHLGFFENGVEDTSSEKVQAWAGAHENYTLAEVEGGTEVRVDVDTPEEYAEDFSGMWPAALQKLKEICER